MNSWIQSQENINTGKGKLPGSMSVPQEQRRKVEEKQVGPYL